MEDWGEVRLSKDEEEALFEALRAAESWERNQKPRRAMGGEPFFENRIECEWLTTIEAASYLSLSPNALRIRVHRGAIPVYKFGKQLRFKREDCRALFQRKGAI